MKRNRGITTILTLGLLGTNILVLSGTAEAARPKCLGYPATKVGTNKPETINGTSGIDVIVAKGGSDQINGKGGDDIICADGGNDVVSGGGGVDIILGSTGNDTLKGGPGGDYLLGQKGADTYKGGSDPDTVAFSTSPSPVIVDLGAGTATGEGSDKLFDINVVFGSSFADTLVGDDATNFLYGEDGNDTIRGLGDLDLITPGNGDDSVDGGNTAGEGFDLDIVYFTGPDDVTVNLQTGDATGQGIDVLENLEAVVGSEGHDDITGDNQSNIIFGGLGNDTMDGGGGFDYASYWFAGGGVTANLSTGTATGEGNDTLVRIEGLLGTVDFPDTLTGDDNDNYLDGDGGNDTLNGGDGDDLFLGGAGDDTMNGGPGVFDMADYFCGGCNLNANLGAGTITGAGDDTVSGLEAVGADDGDDTLIGDDNDNIFFGWGGNDVIQGMGGDDQLDGGGGTDTLNGGEGIDECVDSPPPTDCEEFPASIVDHPLRLDADLVGTFRRNF